MGKPDPCDGGFLFSEDIAGRPCMGPLSKQNQWGERNEPGSPCFEHLAQSLFSRLLVSGPLSSRRDRLAFSVAQSSLFLRCPVLHPSQEMSNPLGDHQHPHYSPWELSSWIWEDLHSGLHTGPKITEKGWEVVALWGPLLREGTLLLMISKVRTPSQPSWRLALK